jgi:Mg-chelatase subunit ChlD
VLLCIDISNSMSIVEKGGERIRLAVAGARRFVAEAIEANYQVGLILWNHGVHRNVALSRDSRQLLKTLDRARSCGGTNITPALRLGIEQLGGLTGDRVLAVFGDGDLGPVKAALAAARDAKARGIRIVVRGLGPHAATELSRIATDADDDPLIPSSDAIEAGLASMARHLTIRRKAR